MSLPKLPGFLLLCLAALFGAPGSAQSAPQVAPKPAGSSAPVFPWPIREIHFLGAKPVLGLMAGQPAAHARCANDGTSFVDIYPDSATAQPGPSMPELYSVSSTASVKHLARKVSVDYTDISVRDFFVADHTLVTLLHAQRRDDRDTAAEPRDVRYFLSVSDYDGDSARLISLDVRFKPLKVALFGSGDFLVLGWDESNLLPLLALVKDDGTIRRFIDLDRKPEPLYKPRSTIKEPERAPETRPDLATLQRAAFVPLLQSGFAHLSRHREKHPCPRFFGCRWTIPIALPGGFVLHDVLPPGERRTLVLRAEEKRDSPPTGKESKLQTELRMFEMDAHYGTLLREFFFDKPAVADVTCSPANKLTAIFYDTVANVVQPADANGTKPAESTENATQLVIVTAPR